MKSYTILVVTFMIASVAIDGTEANYKRINNYLLEKVDSDEVGPNIEAAAEWLKQQSGKPTFFSKVPVSDLKKFTSLREVVDDTKCDRTAYEILRKNEAAVNLHHLNNQFEVIRRVDNVMLKIFKDHAEKCFKVYPVIYRAKMKQLDEFILERVKNLAETIMNADRFLASTMQRLMFNFPRELFSRYVVRYLTLQDFARPGLLYDALKSSVEGDLDSKYALKVPDQRTGKSVLHKDKLKQLVKRNLIEPCQQFVNELGPDLFIPARFDLETTAKIDNEDAYYYLGWSYYMICLVLTEDEKSIYDDVIKSAMGRS